MQGRDAELAAVLEGITDAFFTLDEELHFTYLNREARRILGEEEDLLGKELRKGTPETVGLPLYREFQRAIEEQAAVEFGYYHPPLGRWFEARAHPLAGGLAVCLRRVEGESRSEERLRPMELMERALEASNSGTLITDATRTDNPIIYANHALQRMTGYPEDEMIGRNCRFLQAGDRDQPELDELREALRNGRDWQGVLRNYRKDGTLFYNELYVSPVHGGDGRVTHYIGIQNDVTDRVEAESRRRESERRLRSVLTHYGSEMVTILDPDGTPRYESAAIGSVLGYSHLEESGEDLYGQLHPDDVQKMESAHREHLRVPGLHPPVEYRIRHADGSWLHFESIANNLSDDPEVEGIVVLTRDITARRREERYSKARYEVERVISRSPDLDTAASGILAGLCESLGWEAGELWMPVVADGDKGDGVLRRRGAWHVSASGLTEFEEVGGHAAFARGEGLPGRVWQSGEPAWITDVTQEPGFLRAEAAGTAGLGTALAFPLLLEGDVLGVVSLFGYGTRPPDAEMIEAAGSLGTQLGQFIERNRAEEALREAERRNAAILEAVPDLMFRLSGDGEFLDYQADEDMLYAAPEVFLGRKIQDVMPEEVSASLSEATARALQTGEMQYIEYQLPVPAGMGNFEARILPSGLDEVFTIVRDATERRRAERTVAESESQLAEAQSLAGIGSWEWNLAEGTGSWSRELCSIFGVDPESFEMSWQSMLEFVHPDDRDRVQGSLRQGRYERELNEHEYRIVRPDGETRVIYARRHTERDEQGEPIRVLGTLQDITEHRRAEESSRLLASIVEHSEEAIVANTLDGTVMSWNPAAERLFGYAAEEIVGESVGILNPEENPEENLEKIRLIGRSGTSESREAVRVAKDGSRIEVSVTRSPIRDAAGNITGTSAIFKDISERKAAERALRESEDRFRNLVELSPDGIGVHSEGVLVYLNPAGAHLLGAEQPEDVLGRSMMSIIHPDYREVVRERVGRVQNEGVHAEPLEEKFLRVDGGSVEAEVAGLPITYEGRPAVQFLARDITERKRAEEELRQSEERYRRLVELSPEPLVVHVGGELVYANPAAARVVGSGSAEELIGQRIMDFVHPEFKELAAEMLQSPSAGQATDSLVYQRLIRQDGEAVDIELISVPIVYGDRRAVQVMFRDITARLRAEDALRQSEERYRAIVEDQTEMICRFSPDRALTFVNDAYCQCFGFTHEDLLGTSFMSLVPEEDRPVAAEGLASLTPERPTNTIEHRVEAANGELRWQQWTDRALFDERGELLGYQSVGRDVTARREAEEALQRERNLLRTVMDSTQDAIFAKDTEHRFRLSNAYHQVILGASSQEEVVGKTNAEYWGEEKTAPFHADDRRVLDNGESIVDRQERVHRASGEEMWISTTKVPLRASDGTIEGLVAVSRDMTQRLREQNELATTAARLSSLIQNMPSGILVEDETRNIRHANAAITRMFEMDATPEELTSDECDTAARDVMRLLADPVGFVERIEETISGGSAVMGEEIPLADGRVYERDYVPVFVSGEYRGHMWHYRDLTGRKRAEEEIRQSEARFRALFDQAAVGVTVTDLDRRIIQTNAAYQRITGYGAEDLVGMRTLDITHPDDRAGDENVVERFSQRGDESYLREKRFVRKDGGIIWAKVNSSLVRDEYGEPRFAIGVVEDITGRKLAQEALSGSERLLRAVTRGAPVILFATDREGMLTLAEGKALDLFGLEASDTVGQSIFEAYASLPHIADNVRRALSGEEVAATVELDGLAFEARYSPMRDDSGEIIGSVGVATDITDRHELEKELEHRAFHDPLTDLPNRALFMNRLEHALTRAWRRGEQVAVLFLDLDDFKHVNDSMGHSAGDRLLIEAGRHIDSCLRDEDTVARLGGDEFAVLLEESPEPDFPAQVARRISGKLRAPITLTGDGRPGEAEPEVIVTTSVGIAVGGPDQGDQEPASAEELLQRADAALYRAKETGKDHHELFRQEMQDHSTEVLRMGRDLHLALEREEFAVHYQPKTNLETGECVGLEALVRWEHPERGLVYPEDFIPLTEENGLIVPLGRRVLYEACRQTKEWQSLRPAAPGGTGLEICVNLSVRQLQSPDLFEEVSEALSESGLEPSSLVLEVTEGVLMDQQGRYGRISTLRKLRELGVKLAIDDFGAGYSSLAYLRDLPVDILKIDRSLISGLEEDPTRSSIVTAAIELAHALGLLAVAEGVETAEALAELRRIGCDAGQGYHWSGPLTASEIPGIL